MKAKIKVEIFLDDVKTPNLAHIASAVEEAAVGSFGKAMWELGYFADFRVTKVKFQADQAKNLDEAFLENE